MFKQCLLMGGLLVAVAATAEPVKGEAELGFVQTSGNSETQNIHAKLSLIKETENWKHEGKVTALGSSSQDQTTGQDETTAEKYTAEVKSDRNLDDRSFLYALATYEDDRFSGFDYQATAGVGYGYKVIAEEDKTLTLEVGPGYRYNSIRDAKYPVGPDPKDEGEATLRLAESFDWKFSDTAELKQYVISEGGDKNTITKAGVSVQSKLTGALALKVGVDAKYTDKVPVDATASANAGREVRRDRLDTETYATITYSF